MLAIQVQGYGDFDILQTQYLYYHPDLGKKSDFKISSLGDFSQDRTPDRLLAALKKAGFKPLPNQEISYGGAY